ncbi:hypothetical protein GF318_00100 [Candidatus Micrarchaeota archaeon]|nr:hypothetical protein [Candidatus Micrarchaeota archaeon]
MIKNRIIEDPQVCSYIGSLQRCGADWGTSFCDKIIGHYSYSRPECYSAAALYQGKPSVCAELNDTEGRDNCYYEYAITCPCHEDVCDNVQDQRLKDDCVYVTSGDYYY